MNRTQMFGLVFAVALSLAMFGCKGSRGKVVARVGSETITMDDLDKELKGLPAPFHAQFQNPQAKRMFLDNLITQRLLAQEAERRGLDKDADVERQIKAYRMNLLRQKLIQQIQGESSKVTDEEIGNYYNSHQMEFQTPERARVSHILVKTEADAKKVLGELKKRGATFTDAAKKYSLDQATKDRGGDMGYFTANQPTPLTNSIFELKKVGEVSGPVQSPEGINILLLTEKQPASTRDLESSKEQIRQRIAGERRAGAYNTFIEELKKKGNVKIYEDVLGPTGAPQPPPIQPPPPPLQPQPGPPPQGK